MIIMMKYRLFRKQVALSYMTREEVGEAIGVSEEYVRMMSNEYVNIYITLYEKICRCFRLNWYELLDIPAPANAMVCMENEALHNKNAVLDHVQFAALRKKYKISHEKMAEELNLSRRQAQNLCYKDTNVSLVVYAKICELFNMSLGSMLTYVDCA